MFRLADSIKNEPFLVSQLVREVLLALALCPVWQGLATHSWTDAQLAVLKERLGAVDLLSEYQRIFRGERSLNIDGMEQLYINGRLRDFHPLAIAIRPPSRSLILTYRGFWFNFWYQNMLTYARICQEQLFPAIDTKTRRMNVKALKLLSNSSKPIGWRSYYQIFGIQIAQAIARSMISATHRQTTIDQALTACALEQYRIANGRFPDTLDALVPRFIEKLPHDIINGDPLKYRRTDDGQFILYSVGWNEKDDGGVFGRRDHAKQIFDLEAGDWVWQYPAKQAPN